MSKTICMLALEILVAAGHLPKPSGANDGQGDAQS